MIKPKKLIPGACLLGAVALGGGVLASMPALAASPAAASSPQASAQGNTEANGPDQQDPSYTASITVNDNGPEQTDAQLQSMAKITADQAQAAALAKFPGATVKSVGIEDENGNLVYGVALTDASHNPQDVKVDAGSGAVLNVQARGNDGAESGGEIADTGAEAADTGADTGSDADSATGSVAPAPSTSTTPAR